MALPKKSVLGRGLDALITLDEVKISGSSSINEIELSKIHPNPDQPRRAIEESALEELAQSIRSLGVIQPITLRELSEDNYQIIAGERRYRASLKAGLKAVPAYVRKVSDTELLEMALIENIQREDLNSIEIALAYQNLIDQYSLTQEKLSERVGKNRSTITNYLRLLKLPAGIQMGIKDKKIDMGHARALISIEDPSIQLMVFEEIIKQGLSVRKVEEIVRSLNNGEEVAEVVKKKEKKSAMPEEFSLLKNHLTNFFSSKVQLSINDKGKGKISIPFESEEDLERLIALLDAQKTKI
ncbi:MAG: ParB/RepB/Spo0J family partition protein [Bacteroidales bacterium]